MKIKHFLSALEHDRIHQAIQSAGMGTSGGIVVFISHRKIEDPLAAANRAFRKMGSNNSLLIFLAPKSRKFAVVGGPALHERVGQSWWNDLVALLTRHFKESRYTDGIVAAVDRADHALKTHFPAATTDRTGHKDIVEE